MKKSQKRRVSGRTRQMVGVLLLVLGGGASMALTDLYADIAMGISLIGLVLALGGRRAATPE